MRPFWARSPSSAYAAEGFVFPRLPKVGILGYALLLSLLLHVLVFFDFFSSMQKISAKGGSGTGRLNVSFSHASTLSSLEVLELSVGAGLSSSSTSADKVQVGLEKRRAPVLARDRASTAAVRGSAATLVGRNGTDLAAKTKAPENSAETDLPLSADEIRGYRLSLARYAHRFKGYPAIAREFAWQGVVVLSVYGVPGIDAPVLALTQSSGYELLDAQAMETMASAVRLSSLPESLRGKAFAIRLPLHYRLDD